MKSDWTIRTLKKFFEQKFDSLREAVNKSEANYNERFKSHNEFRGQLEDQARTFMPRLEAEKMFDSHNDKNEAMFKNIQDQIITLSKAVEKIQNLKQGGSNLWGYVVGAVGTIILIWEFFVNK